MTIPHADAPAYAYESPAIRPGRTLAAAIAVFLGGYLLLNAFAGQLVVATSSALSGITGRPSPYLPETVVLLYVSQFLFALVVVVAGLLLADGALPRRLIGAAVVVVTSIVTLLLLALRISGITPFPGGRDGIPFQALFNNHWFAVVLFVGFAWLLTRHAKLGWLVLLATLVLIPTPTALYLAGADAAVVQIVMYLLSGLVGAGIILAGRPWRD